VGNTHRYIEKCNRGANSDVFIGNDECFRIFFGILRKNLIITIEMNFIHINENQSATAKSLLQCKTEPLVIGF
jgi:hypothetical protein